jgi:predicted DsbA family dithiol-disulfide isomerase
MFSDFICPFCYIGFEVTRQLKPEFNFELEWHGYEIHPEWPEDGIAPERAFASMDMETRRAAWERILEMASSVGLEMKSPARLCNSRNALAAGEYAKDAGRAAQFAERIFRAYFCEGADIGDPAILAALGAEAGLDPIAVAEAIKSPKYDMRLKNNAMIAHSRGVDGVPTFFLGEYALRGAQSIDTMRKILVRAQEIFGA